MNVTEMKCEVKSKKKLDEGSTIQLLFQVKAFPVCNLLMITKPQTRVRIFPNNYQVLRCSETREEVRHTKMVEDCRSYPLYNYIGILYSEIFRNITRQNCITEWDRNRDGKLVRLIHCFINTNSASFPGLDRKSRL